tara:strand:- start:1762 stop:2082 length:321 start_codon:yes stop_codon:yes gene_type:complete
MIEIALALSLAVNIFMLWYTRNTLSSLFYISENIGSLYEIIADFGVHLKAVYELERFYGDPTLTNLLEHANAVREEIEVYEEILLLSEPPETEEEELDDSQETQEN